MIPDRRQRIDADVVRAHLTLAAVLHHHGVTVDRHGRSAVCPTCGPRSRADAVRYDLRRGVWACYRGRAEIHGGGPLEALAGLAGLDIRADYPRVLELGAEIAGIAHEVDPAAIRRVQEMARAAIAEREWAAAIEEAATAERRAQAMTDAAQLWDSLARTSGDGRAYLATRGLAAEHVDDLERRDLVRYRRDGSPSTALHDSTGRVRNVVTRWITPRAAKVTGLRDCPTAGTLVGSVDQIVGGVDVVIAEGVIDSLVAAVAYPSAVVLGAHGAGQYATVARVAVPRIRLARGRLLLACDDDDSGTAAGTAAIEAACRGGLSVRRGTCIVIEHGAQDIAEAWQTGWRP